MERPLFSEHWYRVKSLKPRLRAHVRLHRQIYRDDVWYVLEDDAHTRFHRFNTAAYAVIGLLDGQRTVHQVWEQVNTMLGDDAPVQDEIIHLLGQLHQADALQTDTLADAAEMFQRGDQQDQQQWLGRFKNPLAIRIKLFDPDRFLDQALPLVRWLFTPQFMAVWSLLVVLGVLMAGSHWHALVDTARSQALTPMNLVLLWLIYPCVKLLHELGHAIAAKLEGGEVHEMGILFMVFMPVPYVDASAATAFRQKRMRMLVGAAGVMVEMLLAVIALVLWVNMEPGIVRSICFNVVLIGGVSTLLFNGNPLLRFDAYYVLADALGIPNLAQRANQYLGYLVQSHLLGVEDAQSPVTGRGEAPWFVFFAIASFSYRMMILAVICLFLIEHFFVVGILLAAWALYSQVFRHLARGVRFLLLDNRLRRSRGRAVLVSSLGLWLVAMLALGLPVSSMTRFEGVIWPPDEAQLVTDTDGFVAELLAAPGAAVKRGQPLVRLSNDLHAAEMAVKLAHMRELDARSRAARVNDRVETRIVQEQVAALQGEIDRLQQKIDALVIHSPAEGVFVLPQADDLNGQYVKQGRLLGYVVNDERAIARVMVTQEDQDRISRSLDGVAVRLASNVDEVLDGHLLREVPQASHRLPSKVLSIEGGGPFAPAPDGPSELSTAERLFEFEIALPLPTDQAMIGNRVYVRFDHGNESLWTQWSRRLRQLFLRRLDV